RAHDGGQRLGFLFGEIDHDQSIPGFAGEGRLAGHRAEPAAGTVRARSVELDPAETTRAGCADGAEGRARVPEAIRARSIRSRCGRGWDLRDMAHAALPMAGVARPTSWRISRLLKPKVMSAEAR